MLGTKRIVFIILAFVLFTLVYASDIIAQEIESVPAIVIVQRDFLRVSPSKNARSETLVVKGAKLMVTPSANSTGWYFAYLEEAPSVGGYIYGNSIRIVKTQTSKRNTRNDVVVAPKKIILDNTPTIADNTQTENRKPKSKQQTTSGKNYCQPPLFCPDIDDVQVALFDNQSKFEKGKFEKTIDYEKRQATILNTIKLNDSKTAGETLYFLTDGFFDGDFNTPVYNADKEQWTFDLNFKETSTETCLPIISPNTGQYFCLVVRSKLGIKKAVVSMPPTVAKANDNKLKLVFVGKIIKPYIWSNGTSQIRDILSGVYFDLEEIICLNPKTGQKWKVDVLKNTSFDKPEVKTTSPPDEVPLTRPIPELDVKTTSTPDDILLDMRPMRELGSFVSNLVNEKKVNLRTPFYADAKGIIDSEGKFTKDSFQIVKAESSDEEMINIVQRLIEAINASGYLQYLEQLNGKNLNLQFFQNNEKIVGELQCEVESERRASSYQQSLTFLIKIMKVSKTGVDVSQNDKDDLLLLERTTVVSDGKKVIIKFDMPKDTVHDLIKRKLPAPINLNQPISVDNLSEEKKLNTFEGVWQMSFIVGNQTYPLRFNVFKTGSSYKGFLVDKSSSSETFDIKFDGKKFKFKFSGINNLYQKFSISAEGIYEGESINGKMSWKVGSTTTRGDFNGIK